MTKCLVCGRGFDFLPTHLRKAHGITADAYREAYDIPQGEPLASEAYRAAQAEKMRRMQADGTITYDHLGDAVEKSRSAKVRPKRGAALERQRGVLSAARPWEKTQLAPGAKRADGRDADRAREYQREYRKRKAHGVK